MPLFVLIIGFTIQLKAQITEDSTAIKKTVLNYLEGYYTGDEDRIEEALYHDLEKRAIFTTKQGRDFVDDITSMGLWKYTKQKSDDTEAMGPFEGKIEILDIFGNIANVKSYTKYAPFPFVDYIQLGKINGEWKIINVLWTLDRGK